MLKQWYLSLRWHYPNQVTGLGRQPTLSLLLQAPFSVHKHTTAQLYLQVVPGLAKRSERGKMRKNKKGKHHEHYSLSWGK